MKICMLGAGSLGSAIGGTIAAGGSEVTLIDTYNEHVQAVNKAGLVLHTADGEKPVKVRAVLDSRGLEPADLVIVLVKSFHTEDAMQGARNLVGPDTVVMSMQNGLGHEDVLADVVGRAHVLGAKTYVGGMLLKPGHAVAGTAGKETIIGELDGQVSERAKAIAAEFNRAGLKTVVSDNIIGTMWDKLLINVATGAVSAITRLPYGPLYKSPEIEGIAVAAVTEAMAAAKALGVVLSIREPREAWFKASAGLPADFKTSMLQSIEKGQRTEIDFINGAVVRAGHRAGIATPVNETLVACIKGIERGFTQ
jgi:2-dehydropantoate 2-reductase